MTTRSYTHLLQGDTDVGAESTSVAGASAAGNAAPRAPAAAATSAAKGSELAMLRAQNTKLNATCKSQRANVLKAYSLVARLEREARQLAAALQETRAELEERAHEVRSHSVFSLFLLLSLTLFFFHSAHFSSFIPAP